MVAHPLPTCPDLSYLVTSMRARESDSRLERREEKRREEEKKARGLSYGRWFFNCCHCPHHHHFRIDSPYSIVCPRFSSGGLVDAGAVLDPDSDSDSNSQEQSRLAFVLGWL